MPGLCHVGPPVVGECLVFPGLGERGLGGQGQLTVGPRRRQPGAAPLSCSALLNCPFMRAPLLPLSCCQPSPSPSCCRPSQPLISSLAPCAHVRLSSCRRETLGSQTIGHIELGQDSPHHHHHRSSGTCCCCPRTDLSWRHRQSREGSVGTSSLE